MRSAGVAGLVVVLLVALSACGGGEPRTGIAACPADPDPAVLAATALASPPAGDAARGAPLFQRECAQCHSRDRAERGSRFFVGYPRLDCDDYLARATPAYLYTAIARGGAAVGRDEAMKPFAEELSPSQIADLVAYLRRAR